MDKHPGDKLSGGDFKLNYDPRDQQPSNNFLGAHSNLTIIQGTKSQVRFLTAIFMIAHVQYHLFSAIKLKLSW